MKPHFGNDNRNAMADCSTVRPNVMKESQDISESPTELCDDSQSVKDELEPGYIEDRFRVDRKKLEQMLQGNLDHDEESAEEFFQRIMDETSTQITWPSKLKIGAKSKKDPHIKVIGYPEDVKSAKERIMFVLDTKSNRVTLKMDVSHTDHSHVIGKGGNNIKSVMNKTGCHIHFPDSNRGNTVQEKSNQVSIAGQPAGVESARAQIRELLPLVFMFELPVTGVLQPLPDASSATIQQLQQQYSITISFRQRPRMYVTTVIVRGTVCNAKMVKEGTGRLMDHLTGSVGTSLAVSMQLEIAPQHHLFIIGRGGMNIKQIMQQTKASIHFPDPNTATPQRKGTVYITGSIESVFMARQHLIGYLPLVLMFDVKEEIEMDQARITQLMEQLDVFISVKPKPKQPSKSVIVKSIERNAANMYLARLTLLGLKKDDKNFPPTCVKPSTESILSPNNGLGLSAFGFFSQNLLSVNTANSLLMINGNKSPTTMNSPQNSPHCSSPNHWVSPPPGMYTPMMVLNPNPNVPNQLELLTQCKDMKDLNQNSAFRVPSSHGSSSNIVVHSETNSPSRSPCASPKSLGRSASAIDLAALQKVNNTFSQMIARDASPSSSGHTLDLLGLSKAVGANPQNSSLFLDGSLNRQTLESSLNRGSLQNGCDKRERICDQETSDNLHVVKGNDLSGVTESSLFPNPYSVVEDYEEKKLLARKAMQKKPEGESRIPTNHWSGMGFSKSMPESAIRERISRNQGGLRYCEPPMETTYENPNEGEEVDHDPWKDSNQVNIKPINPAPGEYPSLRRKYEYCLSSSNHVDSASLPSVKTWWTHKTDLAELFSKLGLGKYTDLFQQQEIDLATFLTLTDQDLRELGISTFGARRKMLLAIADLNKRRTIMNAHMGNNPYPDSDHARLNNVSPTDFSENGTTSNLDSTLGNPNSTSNHYSDNPPGLEHLQIATSMTSGHFSEKGSPVLGIRRGSAGLLSSSANVIGGGRLSQSLNQSSHLSRSGHLNLSHSGSLHHSGHLLSHSRLTQSGHFNHSLTDSPFQEKTIKAPPGFPPRNLNSSAGGNLFGDGGSTGLGTRHLSPNSGNNPFQDNNSGLGAHHNSRPDSASLSGRW